MLSSFVTFFHVSFEFDIDLYGSCQGLSVSFPRPPELAEISFSSFAVSFSNREGTANEPGEPVCCISGEPDLCLTGEPRH